MDLWSAMEWKGGWADVAWAQSRLGPLLEPLGSSLPAAPPAEGWPAPGHTTMTE
jgi:hypothetical protein